MAPLAAIRTFEQLEEMAPSSQQLASAFGAVNKYSTPVPANRAADRRV